MNLYYMRNASVSYNPYSIYKLLSNLHQYVHLNALFH